jgi:uncharacterized protein (DUF2141 family)
MRNSIWLLPILFYAASPITPAESKDCAEKDGLVLTLKVDGVRSSKGQIRAELLGKQVGEAKAKTVTYGVKDAQTGSVLIEFPGLAPGDYAVQLYHDENANGKVDMNMVGIPLEGFGFSNTPMVTGGIPEFDKMKVSLSADSTTTAVLAYAP